MDEQALFRRALKLCEGNKTALAKACGVSRQTIHAWETGPLSDYAVLVLEKFIRGRRAA